MTSRRVTAWMRRPGRSNSKQLIELMVQIKCRGRARFGLGCQMFAELVGKRVVIDLVSTFVCLGTLVRADDHFLELKNADFHDLRDTKSTREVYVADAVKTGIKRNRKRVIISRPEVVAI